MRLFIEPSDVWLFRDGRPFNAGSDHRAASLFPPPPSVLQGALRAAHVTARGKRMEDYLRGDPDLEAEIGKPDQPPGFQMRGPFVAIRTNTGITRYLPIPADATRASDRFHASPLVARNAFSLQTNLPETLTYLIWQPQGQSYGWATENAIRRYLQGADARDQIIEGDTRTDEDLFKRESRFGVGLDYDARRYVESALYEAEFIRPRAGVGLDVQVDTLSGWTSQGIIKLGGEGRMARYELLPDLNAEDQKLPARFKLYFATPALFKKGWVSEDWNQFFTQPVQLVAAALWGYQVRGGFDLFKQEHKPSQRYVPAGSVYYFESSDGVELKKLNVTDEDVNLGLGQVLIGRWTNV